ncbi:PREDICTED: pentatricopeptide repeat-containing protein At1g08070, chloroplastic-like [Nelumbo nucifera]|uniref:Pentatricopeptide repeat-containing protein At1g08070, chloroplastic-like n=1 Tax=Nelumbo nucifera TaxID=4432 RepID=A0A1U8Q3T9_NELNU|nr:PREDICTED: pentatricopeptide repeat-containing protein At1g08070, chloroplastic-like [Nelumbo nucifera]
MTRTRNSNGRHVRELSSIPDNRVLDNVSVVLQSMDLSGPEECSKTYPLILQNCRKFDRAELGFQIHAHMIVSGVELCAFLGSQLLEFYCKLGVQPDRYIFPKIFKACSELKNYQMGKDVQDYVPKNWIDFTRRLFNEMEYKDVVLTQMVVEGVKPNAITIASIVSACTNFLLLRYGKEINGYCIKREELDSDVLVGNLLADLYTKCQALVVASRIFKRIKQKDLVSWNGLITGYTHYHGHPRQQARIESPPTAVPEPEEPSTAEQPPVINLVEEESGKLSPPYAPEEAISSEPAPVNFTIHALAYQSDVNLYQALAAEESSRKAYAELNLAHNENN